MPETRTAYLVPISPAHPALHRCDRSIAQRYSLRVSHEDAGEETNKILCVNDSVRAFGRHGEAHSEDQLVMPLSIMPRDFLGNRPVSFTLLGSKEDRL